MKQNINDKRAEILMIAFLTAFAVTVYLVEFIIPKPFPFLKLGLANIVVLLLISLNKMYYALLITVSKTLIGGFLSGTLINPSTIFSLGGSLGALGIMIFFLKINSGLSLIGLSITGAVVHNFCQIYLVRCILIKDDSVFYLLPFLIVIGVITGFITGYFAMKIVPVFKPIFEKIIS